MSTSILRRIEDYLKSDQEENVLIGFALLNNTDADIRLKLTVLHRCGFEKDRLSEKLGLQARRTYEFLDGQFFDKSDHSGLLTYKTDYGQISIAPNPHFDGDLQSTGIINIKVMDKSYSFSYPAK